MFCYTGRTRHRQANLLFEENISGHHAKEEKSEKTTPWFSITLPCAEEVDVSIQRKHDVHKLLLVPHYSELLDASYTSNIIIMRTRKERLVSNS